MEKALIFSDLHVHQYKQFNEGDRRLKNGIDFIDYLFRLASKNGIKYIIFTGDLTNTMAVIATKVMNALMACFWKNFQQYHGIKFIAISGNHDYCTKNQIDAPGESALHAFAEVFPHEFILIDNDFWATAEGHYIYGLPYFDHAEHFRKALESLEIRKEGPAFLLMHQMVASGLPKDDDIEATDPLFDPFDFVYNGHLHDNKQVTDKFINVGSPMARDAGDIGKTKGFWVVDLDDPIETISFKDITDRYPKFVQKIMGEEYTEEDRNNFIIWIPAPIANDIKDKELSAKFSTSLAPATIMENYCSEVLKASELKDKLAYGLTLL